MRGGKLSIIKADGAIKCDFGHFPLKLLAPADQGIEWSIGTYRLYFRGENENVRVSPRKGQGYKGTPSYQIDVEKNPYKIQRIDIYKSTNP